MLSTAQAKGTQPYPFATGALCDPPTEVEQCADDVQGGSELQYLLSVHTWGVGDRQMGSVVGRWERAR